MGLPEMLVIGWMLVALIAVFLVAAILIYYIVRKAVRDELEKSGIVIPPSADKPN